MGRKTLNLLEDEGVAECVKKYPCLFEKSDEFYKDKRAKANAWKKVEEELLMDEGKPEQIFENLKKRFSKKRLNVKRLKQSGVGRSVEYLKAEEELAKYRFFEWIQPYVASKDSLNNLSLSQNISTEASGNKDNEVDEPLEADFVQEEAVEVIQENESTQKKVEEPKRKIKVASDELLLTTNKCLHERSRQGYQPMEDDEAVFGKMVANELRSLPKKLKITLKREINESIYRHQLKDVE